MRTTITLASDVAAAVGRHRTEQGVGVSEAVNELIRRGLASRSPTEPFRQATFDMGPGVDVANVVEAIETLEGPAAR